MSKSKTKSGAKSVPAASKANSALTPQIKASLAKSMTEILTPTAEAPAAAAELQLQNTVKEIAAEKFAAGRAAAEPADKPESKAKRFTKAEGAVEQNGIKRPAADTLCGRVWAALDQLKADGKEPTAKNAAAAFDGVAIAAATIRTQSQRWKAFHGFKREEKKAAPAVISEEAQQQTA